MYEIFDGSSKSGYLGRVWVNPEEGNRTRALTVWDRTDKIVGHWMRNHGYGLYGDNFDDIKLPYCTYPTDWPLEHIGIAYRRFPMEIYGGVSNSTIYRCPDEDIESGKRVGYVDTEGAWTASDEQALLKRVPISDDKNIERQYNLLMRNTKREEWLHSLAIVAGCAALRFELV